MPKTISDGRREFEPIQKSIERPVLLDRTTLSRPRTDRDERAVGAVVREESQAIEPERWDGMS